MICSTGHAVAVGFVGFSALIAWWNTYFVLKKKRQKKGVKWAHIVFSTILALILIASVVL